MVHKTIRKDTAAYASLPLSTMSKSKCLTRRHKSTSAEQTLFPTEVGRKARALWKFLAPFASAAASMGGI